jgi:KRAB domain-containing zinc finger protein
MNITFKELKVIIKRMSAESETKEELLRCSHCKCRKLPEYFSKNVRGVLYKTCDKCRYRYRCEQCEDKFFNSKSKLERHIKAVHDKIKDHHCSECEMSFSQPEKLERHIKSVHDKIKDHHCPNCEYSCSNNGDLQQHIKRIHLKIKDHHCPDCEASFSANGDLQQHIKQVHTKIRDHHCQDCKASFSTNGKLREHIKQVHTKIRDHHCQDCKASFSTNGKLQRHINAVHLNIRDHHCPDCKACFSTNGDLQSHLKTCTGPDYTPLSGLEMRCKETLTDLGFVEDVDYIYNHTFSKLTDYCGQHLRPDFRFINHKIMIECDGSQHYKVKEFGSSREDAEKNFEKTKANDKVKDEFCDQFGYKMIRIPYWDIMNILEILSVELYDIVKW